MLTWLWQSQAVVLEGDGESALWLEEGGASDVVLIQRRASKQWVGNAEVVRTPQQHVPPSRVLVTNLTGVSFELPPDEKGTLLLIMLGRSALVNWRALVVLIVMIAALVLLFYETHPPYVIFLLALVIVWNIGALTLEQAISGFSDSSVISVGALFIVIKGVDRSRAVDTAAKACLGEKTSQTMALLRFCSTVIVGASFTNATPLVALLMPILRDWARSHGFASSQFLIPLAHASGMAGLLTLTGTVTNLVINGMLEKSTGEKFKYMDVAWVGLPITVLGLVYLVLYAPRLLPMNQDGLFQMLESRKEDMVTELQVSLDFPLVGKSVRSSLEKLGIPRTALVKIFRQPPMTSANHTFLRRVTDSSCETFGSDLGFLKIHQKSKSADNLCAGLQVNEVEAEPSIREIFPVPEEELLAGGDVLILSLPREQCIALANSPVLMQKLDRLKSINSESSLLSGQAEKSLRSHLEACKEDVGVTTPEDTESPAEEATGGSVVKGSLRICNIDISDISGDHEFVELVVSRQNPFVGGDFSGPERLAFEEHYQVAVLAVRHAIQETNDFSQFAELPGQFANSRNELFVEATSPRPRASQRADSELVAGPEGLALRPGDTLLVLAGQRDVRERLEGSKDFLASTLMMRKDEDHEVHWTDYLPLVLFIAAVALVAVGQWSMVQAAVLLAAVYLAVGWVAAAELKDIVDWGLLVLIGSALGLAEAFQTTGLSSEIASLIKLTTGAGGSIVGTTCLLYLITIVLTELVGSNPAAALAMPLALDLSKSLHLESAKPLAMTVMLASSSAFAMPAMNTQSLMVMGPGGYRLTDFLRVGLPLNGLCFIVGCLLLPILWPAHIAHEST